MLEETVLPPFKEGYSLLTGTSVFISMLPWDTSAVGLATEAPDGVSDPEQFSDLIHPLRSGATIKTFDSPLVELDEFSRNTPFMQGALEIPADYFRGPMGPALAKILDEKWLEKYDGEPPEGEQPPSQSWSGKWYFYICCWWKVVGPEKIEEPGGAT